MSRAHDEDIESNNGLILCFSTEEPLLAPGRSWIENCLLCIMVPIILVIDDIFPHIGTVIEGPEVICGPADGSTISSAFEDFIELCFQRAGFAKGRKGRNCQHEHHQNRPWP